MAWHGLIRRARIIRTYFQSGGWSTHKHLSSPYGLCLFSSAFTILIAGTPHNRHTLTVPPLQQQHGEWQRQSCQRLSLSWGITPLIKISLFDWLLIFVLFLFLCKAVPLILSLLFCRFPIQSYWLMGLCDFVSVWLACFRKKERKDKVRDIGYPMMHNVTPLSVWKVPECHSSAPDARVRVPLILLLHCTDDAPCCNSSLLLLSLGASFFLPKITYIHLVWFSFAALPSVKFKSSHNSFRPWPELL